MSATTPQYDILGIGNAIVDVVSPADDAFLSKHDMRKGGMALIGDDQADALYAAMPPGQESSGGSVANTCAVAAELGARVAYLGKVAGDKLGESFRQDIAAAGVHFPTPALSGGAPTARCLILVTPDGQRTMNTYLGACVSFGVGDVDIDLVAKSAIIYLEGYLFDPPAAQAAFHQAAAAAHAAGRQVALSLSDAFCVDRHRAAFRALVAEHVDILFANEAEICSLYEEGDFESAASLASKDVALAVLTRSEAGSVILQGATRVTVGGGAGPGVGHDRRRRRLCCRVPGRLRRRAPARRVRQDGQHRGGGGHRTLRRPPAARPAGADGTASGVNFTGK